MRGGDERSGSLFSYVDLERGSEGSSDCGRSGIVSEASVALWGEFAAMYARLGRPSIVPEKLLRAMLLQASIRCARSAS